MLIHIRHTTSSYERLMAAATMPFNYKLAALASFARQAGATFYCVKINQAEETPPTFVTFYFNAAVPLTPEELFPYLLNKDRGGELPALGLTTLAAGLWDVVSTDKDGSNPRKALFTPEAMGGFATVIPDAYEHKLPASGPVTIISWPSDEPITLLQSLSYGFLQCQPLKSSWSFENADSETGGYRQAKDYFHQATAIGKAGPYRMGLYKTPEASFDESKPNINYLGEPYRLDLPRIYSEDKTFWHAQVNASETPDLVRDLRRPVAGLDTYFRKELRKLVYAFLYRCAEISPGSSFPELQPPEVPDHSIHITSSGVNNPE